MSLDDLPPEILLVILCFLDPVDIIRLRLTCQTLFNFTIKRSVWTDAYWSFTKRNDIHSGTYDPRSMSTVQLEGLITAPSRFIHRLLSAVPSSDAVTIPSISPTRRRVILIDGLQNPDRVTFVPGGRFLVVEAPSQDRTDAGLVFAVIDLEPSNGEYAVLRRWSSPDIYWRCTLMPSVSNDNRTLGFVMGPRDSDWWTSPNLTILYITVAQDASESTDEEATITNGQLKWYTLPSSRIIQKPGRRLRSYSLYDGLFIFNYIDRNGNQHIAVWDFLADKAVVWEISDRIYTPLTIHRGYISMMVYLSLRGWKIPELTAVKKGTVLRLENHPLAFNVSFHSNRALYHCRGSAIWYESNSPYGSQVFDLIGETLPLYRGGPRQHTLLAWNFTDLPISRGDVSNNGRANQTTHFFSLIPSSSVPTKLGEEDEEENEGSVGYSDMMRDSAVTYVNHFKICEHHVIRILKDRKGRLYAHVTPLLGRKPADDKARGDAKEFTLKPQGVLVNINVNDQFVQSATSKFDVVSGRLAHISQDNDSVVVTDYNSQWSPPQ